MVVKKINQFRRRATTGDAPPAPPSLPPRRDESSLCSVADDSEETIRRKSDGGNDGHHPASRERSRRASDDAGAAAVTSFGGRPGCKASLLEEREMKIRRKIGSSLVETTPPEERSRVKTNFLEEHEMKIRRKIDRTLSESTPSSRWITVDEYEKSMRRDCSAVDEGGPVRNRLIKKKRNPFSSSMPPILSKMASKKRTGFGNDIVGDSGRPRPRAVQAEDASKGILDAPKERLKDKSRSRGSNARSSRPKGLSSSVPGSFDSPNIIEHGSSGLSLSAFEERLKRKLDGNSDNSRKHSDSSADSEAFGERIKDKSSRGTKGGVTSRPNEPSSSMPGDLNSPGINDIDSSGDALSAFEERLKRKLENEGSGPPRNQPDAAIQAKALEERVRNKLSEETGAVRAPRPKGLSSSLGNFNSPGVIDNSREALSSFEERLKRKLQNGDNAPPKNRSDAATQAKTFEEKVRNKLSENIENSYLQQEDTVNLPIIVEKDESGGCNHEEITLADDKKDVRLKQNEDIEKSCSTICQEDYFEVMDVDFEGITYHMRQFEQESGNLKVPVTHPSFLPIIDALSSAGIEELLKKRWEYQMASLRAFRRMYGDLLIPLDHPALGTWAITQRDHFKLFEQGLPSPLTKRRYNHLKDLGFREFVNWMDTYQTKQQQGSELTEESCVDQKNEAPQSSATISDSAPDPPTVNIDQVTEIIKNEKNQKKKIHKNSLEDCPKEGQKPLREKASVELREAFFDSGADPQSTSLDEKIEMRKKKRANREKFLERGLKAHSKEERKPLRDKALVAAEMHQKRMLYRSLRKINGNLSKKVINEDEKSEKEGMDSTIGVSSRRLLNDYSYIVMSSSCSNLCQGSWECKRCTFINEPVGFEKGTSCRFCNAPREDCPHPPGNGFTSKQARYSKGGQSRLAGLKPANAMDDIDVNCTIELDSILSGTVSTRHACGVAEDIIAEMALEHQD